MTHSPSKKALPCGRPAPQASPPVSDEKLERWRTRLKAHLGGHSLKFSEQRWKIAKLILGTKEHFSAQEIVREVLKAYPDIGSATVYRNIKVLCDARILKETLVDADGRVVYEVFDEEHHDHIVCLDCGQIFEFHDEKIEERQEKVTESLHFEEIRHRHVIYAKCQYKK